MEQDLLAKVLKRAEEWETAKVLNNKADHLTVVEMVKVAVLIVAEAVVRLSEVASEVEVKTPKSKAPTNWEGLFFCYILFICQDLEKDVELLLGQT
jgi:hypothetical protein